MMKISGLWVLFFVAGTALVLLSFSSSRTASSIPDMVFSHHADWMRMTATSRKIKENGYNQRTDKRSDEGDVSLEDYRAIDPVPSSKASVRHGPIAHGTPLNPYIPKPSPPGHPKNGGST